MLSRLLPILILNLIAVNSYASSVCDELLECQQLKTQLTASLATVNARIQELLPEPQFADIARNNDGSPRYMTRAKAIKYCASRGQHLPSAKELAHLPAAMGAAGISETKKDQYYSPVSAKNVDGSVDNFYFSNSGYSRPPGDLGNNWFWSSSIDLTAPTNAFGLSGIYGVVSSFKPEFKVHGAVRCVRGQ